MLYQCLGGQVHGSVIHLIGWTVGPIWNGMKYMQLIYPYGREANHVYPAYFAKSAPLACVALLDSVEVMVFNKRLGQQLF